MLISDQYHNSIVSDNSNRNKTMRAFISNFISDEFFIDVIKIGLYPSEFDVNSLTDGSSVIKYIQRFFRDLSKKCSLLKIENTKRIRSFISLCNTILNIREERTSVINYDNIFQHFPSVDLAQQELISAAIENKIEELDEFSSSVNTLLNMIQVYYEVDSISTSITMFDNFSQYALRDDISVFEAAKIFKENVLSMYNDLSKLQSVKKFENEKNYFIISDEQSVKSLSDDNFEYISTGYSFFNTGYKFIDESVDGFESNSVHVLAAPSNHGKSIFKVNLTKSIIKSNDFDENDVILYVTLEDSIYKLNRRFCIIHGNYDSSIVKKLYKSSYQILSSDINSDFYQLNSDIGKKIKSTFDNILKNSFSEIIESKANLILRHDRENVFSAGDLSKFIDRLKVEGLNVRLVLIDYIDTMTPTVRNHGLKSDYEIHGVIVQELRNVSKAYKIPIITATQLKRGSENTQFSLATEMIGDSIKKQRFSDFIYMFRQDPLKNPFSPEVSNYVISDDLRIDENTFNQDIMERHDKICEDLIPIEMKITKAKDSENSQIVYFLFCKRNLRIYENLNQYLNDIPDLLRKSNKLSDDIEIIKNMNSSSAAIFIDSSNDFSNDFL